MNGETTNGLRRTGRRPPRLGRGARLEAPPTPPVAQGGSSWRGRAPRLATRGWGVWAGPVSARFRTPSRAAARRPDASARGRPADHDVRPPETALTTRPVRVGAGFEPATAEFQLGALPTELANGGMAGVEPALLSDPEASRGGNPPLSSPFLTPPSLEPVRGTGAADHGVRRRPPPARGYQLFRGSAAAELCSSNLSSYSVRTELL